MKQSADQPLAPASKPEAKPGAKSDPKDDLKTLPLPEVGEKLESSPEGLTQAEAQKRLAQYGPNELVEKKTNLFLKFLSYFWGRKKGVLSKNPRQTIMAVILGCGIVNVMVGVRYGVMEAVEVFGFFFAAGFPVTVEHIISTIQFKAEEKRIEIVSRAQGQD